MTTDRVAPWTSEAHEGVRPDLAAFVARHPARAHGHATWLGGKARLRVTAHLGDELPPVDLVTSVRSVVLRGRSVLVLSNTGGEHVVPGGRRELGETLLESLRREVLEETGWTIGEPSLLGVLRFSHLSPRPEGDSYPYPDFVQLVYVAEAADELPGRRLADDYEEAAEFRPVDDLRMGPTEPPYDIFLRAALDRLAP